MTSAAGDFDSRVVTEYYSNKDIYEENRHDD